MRSSELGGARDRARRDRLAGVRDVPVDAFEHGADLVARLADRLAHLARGELRTPRPRPRADRGTPATRRRARRTDARPTPAARRAPRDLLRDLAVLGDRNRTDDLARGRIADLDRVRLRDRHRLALRRRSPRGGIGGAPAPPGRPAGRRARAGTRRSPTVRPARAAASSATPSGPGRRASCCTNLGRGQPRQRVFDVGQRTERVPALGALLELARRLRAAQQQHAEQRRLRPVEPERLLRDVAMLDHALPGRLDPAGQLLGAQRVERGVDLGLAVVHDRVAVRRLVARGHDRVERQRIVVGRRDRLLHEAAEHPRFFGSERRRSPSVPDRSAEHQLGDRRELRGRARDDHRGDRRLPPLLEVVADLLLRARSARRPPRVGAAPRPRLLPCGLRGRGSGCASPRRGSPCARTPRCGSSPRAHPCRRCRARARAGRSWRRPRRRRR